MTGVTSLITNLNRIAPALAAVLLLSLLVTRPFEVRDVPGTDEYFADIRTRVESIPYKIDSWLGRDVDVSVAAVRLLKPNIIVQRQYTDQKTGHSVQLLVVHCGDTRDMRGHYPPVCYPAHGWRRLASETRQVRVRGLLLPATLYHFASVMNGVERRMSVVNLFVVPREDAQFFADMDGLERASQDVIGAGLGAAQIQIVSMGDDVNLNSDAVVEMFFESLEPVLQVIAEGAPKHGS